MFTGLIGKVGRIGRVDSGASGGRLVVAVETAWDPPLALGESISVSGACLTVAEAGPRAFACDLLFETLGRTNLGSKRPGARVNLERALLAGDRLGGHIVAGHVDGVGKVLARTKAGRDWTLEIGCPAGMLKEMAVKGSVALDGVSLTVAGLSDRGFSVCIIPFTWENTTLPDLRDGDPVNLETDSIAKYVMRYLSAAHPAKGLSEDDLRRTGFLP